MSVPFARRWPLALLFAFATGAFLVSVVLSPRPTGVGPADQDVSALGLAGLARLMAELGVADTGGGGVSVVTIADSVQALGPLPAGTVLVVLPKWTGRPDPEHPGWVTDLHLLPTGRPGAIADQAGFGGRVVRRPVTGWTAPRLDLPPPDLSTAQLLEGGALVPELAASEGVLIGRLGDVWVLTDPEVVDNHGLARPANRRLAVALLDHLRDGGPVRFVAPVAVPAPDSLVDALVRPPFLGLTLVLAGAVGLMLWAAMPRFGAPERPAPALAPGAATLVRSGAEILVAARAWREIAEGLVHAAERRIRGRHGLDIPAREERRRPRHRLVDLRGRAEAVTRRASLIHLITDVDRWQEEMRDEPGDGGRPGHGGARRNRQGGGRP